MVLSPAEYEGSVQLKEWARKNKVQKYIRGDLFQLPSNKYPPEMVMNVNEMVDAALAASTEASSSQSQPSLTCADWEAYEATREKLIPNLSRSSPAERYKVRSAEIALDPL